LEVRLTAQGDSSRNAVPEIWFVAAAFAGADEAISQPATDAITNASR
jgi:hypothetical protein